MRSTLRQDIRLMDAEAAESTEVAGIAAFNNWYGIHALTVGTPYPTNSVPHA